MKVEFLADDRPLDLVEAAVDIAFLLGALEDSRNFTKRIGGFDRILAASPSFLNLNDVPKEPTDLADQSRIVFTTTPEPDIWRLENGMQKAEVRVSGPVRANSGGIVHEAMLRGIGIGFVPAFLILKDLRV